MITGVPRICTRCLYTQEHPFGLEFDADGVCTGCITHREKFELDWRERWIVLEARAAALRKSRGKRTYDCVVPVRGTPEHFYVLEIVRNRLGLQPLVVAYNSQFNSGVGIRNLDRMRDVFDVDILIYTSNPFTYKKLVRESLARFGNLRWPYLAGETAFAVRTATERRIPWVVWPYHQPTEQVGMHSYLEEPEMSWRSWVEFDLSGNEPDALTASETAITPRDVWDLQYPSNRILRKSGVVGLYLSNFLPWDSRLVSEEMIGTRGALGARNPRTFDSYDRIDDVTYMGAHDVLKWAKLGYSRVTDNLCREIRFGRIGRSDALDLRAFYERQFPARQIRLFLDWLGMSESAFHWFLRHTRFGPELELNEVCLGHHQSAFVDGFLRNGGEVMDAERFITYGKGLELREVLPGATPPPELRERGKVGD
jgi:N-acetyl sugar amidotransferase